MVNNGIISAAVIGKSGGAIGYILSVDDRGEKGVIEVAGVYTIDGSAINVKIYKISRSKANIAKALYSQPVSIKSGYYTFHPE